MENLKKVISLHYASKISGYHQDYLSALIRKNEIKGVKMGGNWFTTEESVKNYVFKQKIRNKNWVVKCCLYIFKKINKSFVYSIILLALLGVGIYFYNKNFNTVQNQPSTTPVQDINKLNPPENLNF
jgi:hypothetical protein